jgi:hypothetical protein
LRIACAIDKIRPSFFQQQFFAPTVPGDDQPPGRHTNPMNRFLNT